MSHRWCAWAIALAFLVPVGAAAQVRLTVHVVAHDAKLIGTAVGGARVTVRNAATGVVLARGEHAGGTGNTSRILERTPRATGVFTGTDAAALTLTVPIDTPTVVEVEAEGPLGYPEAMQRASKTLLLVPGQDIDGDGLVLTLHGFIVELLLDGGRGGGTGVAVRARIRMLCSCPFTAGGVWDAARMTVVARVYAGTRIVTEAALAFTGEENIWAGSLPAADLPAGAHLVVLAADAGRANTGRSESLALY